MVIQAYQKEWQNDFESIAKVLRQVLSHPDVSIEHVGSTAVPGLAAKPVIDIDVVYPTSLALNDIQSALASIGYYHNGDQGIRGREAFKRLDTHTHSVLDRIAHHLYVCREDNDELKRHILFRNYLRKHPEAKEEYQELKLRIAVNAKQNRKLYARLKEVQARNFIEEILQKASSY